jgi:Ca2+-binding RTX toxin-like protein
LRSIENVNGSNHNETIIGNEQDNVLDDGFGNDTISGGDGTDTVSYLSHDGGLFPTGETNTISLGKNGADGSYTRADPFKDAFGVTHFQVSESDILRDIENVTGSNRGETINGNEQDNVLAGRGGMTRLLVALEMTPTIPGAPDKAQIAFSTLAAPTRC